MWDFTEKKEGKVQAHERLYKCRNYVPLYTFICTDVEIGVVLIWVYITEFLN